MAPQALVTQKMMSLCAQLWPDWTLFRGREF